MTRHHDAPVRMADILAWSRIILGPDMPYMRLAIVYGLAISLLSLATPISVQLLINSVANTGLPGPLFTLAAILFVLLLLVVALSALRVWLLAMFERRIFARLVAEITTRAVHAQNPFFNDARRDDLFNRFFDLATVQKSVPSLVIGGFTIVLQSVVGLAVTSFYHPFFFAFNMVLILAVFLVWAVWSRRAIGGAIALSHRKHDTARWLESVGGSNGFYKSSSHLDFAIRRSKALTADYVAAHERYFRASFAQTTCLLLIYAIASAALLALGGWLILQGSLSIGQLVAAELILSGVFYGISQLGTYLDAFYDLAAALEEIMMLYDIPQERALAGRPVTAGSLTFRGATLGAARFDFALAEGEQIVAVAAPGVEPSLMLLMKRHIQPDAGLVMVGDADLGELDMYRLRSEVAVIDRPALVEVSIRDYLLLGAPDVTAGAMLDMLAIVGLDARIATLAEGLDTPLASSGWPLSIGEVIALKLAATVLARPRIVVLSTLTDLLPGPRVRAALDELRRSGSTVLIFTRHPGLLAPDGYLWIGDRDQRRFHDFGGFGDFITGLGDVDVVRS